MSDLSLPAETVTQSNHSQPASRPRRAPWSPLLISWVCLLFSPIPALLLYALNFERLGRPERKKPLLWWLAGWTLFFTLWILRDIALGPLLTNSSRDLRPFYIPVLFFIAWRLYLGQSTLFTWHLQSGGRRASWVTALPISLLSFVPLLVLATVGMLIQDRHAEQQFTRAQTLMESDAPAQVREAETIFKRLTVTNPEEAGPHLNLAIIYFNSERDEAAKREVEIALQLDPDDADAKSLLKEMKAYEIEAHKHPLD